jgi:regulator of sigma E protease
VRKSRDQTLEFTWQHYGEIKTASISPVTFYDPIAQDTVGQIGVFMPHGRKYLSPIGAFSLAVERTGGMISRMLTIFYQLITRKIPARQLGGPIAIFKLSSESAQWGFEYLLGLLVIISINLGLINLFPIPALDGGHIIIATIEAVRKKRFSKNTRMIIQQVGYAIIFILIIFVTFNDITR